MSSARALLLPLLFSAALLAAGCEPGRTSFWSPQTQRPDAGSKDASSSEDIFGQDATDALDAVDAVNTEDVPDVFSEPDAPLADAAQPERDAADIAEPDPPLSWDCSPAACSTVDNISTSLGSMREVDGCAFELALQHPISQGRALADRLLERLEAESLGTRRSFNYVTEHLNREGRSGLSSATLTRLSGLSPQGFRWNTGDENVDYWYPQGITGSSDAREDGLVNAKRWVMNAWYHKTDARPTKGARLALADISDPANIKYRLLLLVDPIEDADGKPNFKEASYDSGNALHAGGIVWYGDYLFVADTAQGFRVYDLTRIFSPSEFDNNKIGISGGQSNAHGYGYAVPRIARYRWASGSCKSNFSFLGLDRTSNPPALVSGQYDASSHNEKMLVWPLDPATHLLEERGGTTRATQAAVIGQTRAQGALRAHGSFYVSCSSQDGNRGRLYKGKPGQSNTSVNWVYGAEDVYFQRDANRIWTGAEHPGSRDVVSIPLP